MKKLVWAAGVVLAFAVLYPNGISLSTILPAKDDVVVSDVASNPEIVTLLSGADAADKARIVSVYRGLKAVLDKDNGGRVNTTEKFEELHGETLKLALDTPGKYPGLDIAIEAVFYGALHDADTDASVVNAITPLVQNKLVKACEIVMASAR